MQMADGAATVNASLIPPSGLRTKREAPFVRLYPVKAQGSFSSLTLT